MTDIKHSELTLRQLLRMPFYRAQIRDHITNTPCNPKDGSWRIDLKDEQGCFLRTVNADKPPTLK